VVRVTADSSCGTRVSGYSDQDLSSSRRMTSNVKRRSADPDHRLIGTGSQQALGGISDIGKAAAFERYVQDALESP
jgi:hypothetical protein